MGSGTRFGGVLALRRFAGLFVLLVTLLAFPSAAGAAIDGKLKQLPLPQGCLDDAAAQGCQNVAAPMTNVGEPAFHPNGRFLYVPGRDSDSLNFFERDTGTGALTERACLRFGAATGCTNLAATPGTDVSPLEDATGADVSTDGDGNETLYVVGGAAGGAAGGAEPDGIASFTIGPDGTPSFLQCVNSDGSGACTSATALSNPVAVTVSPDGNSVYVASFNSHAIAIFKRDRGTGVLSQVGMTAAQQCLKRDGTEGCTTLVQLEQPRDIEVTPDNQQVVVANVGCIFTINGCNSMVALNRDPSTSVLTAQPGTEGCIVFSNFTGVTACQQRPFFTAPNQVAITNDGRSMFFATRLNSFSSTYSVVTVDRNPANGDVTPRTPCTQMPAGTVGCNQESKALVGAHDIALSPDNQYVYTTGYEGQRIGIFGRNGEQLVLRPGDFGCLAASNQTDSCGGVIQGGTTTNIEYVQPSPDGKHVYAFGSGAATGKIFSFAVDHAPVCASSAANSPINTSLRLTLPCSDGDGDTMSLEIVEHPGNGQLGAIQNGQVTYGPFVNTTGTDSFKFRATAAGVQSDIATFTVNVTPPGQPTPAKPTLASTVSASWKTLKTYTLVRKLSANKLPAGSTVRVTCKAKRKRACPKRRTVRVPRARAKLDLAKPFRKRKLPVKAVIEIRITKPGFVGKSIRYTVRKGKKPSARTRLLP